MDKGFDADEALNGHEVLDKIRERDYCILPCNSSYYIRFHNLIIAYIV